MMNYLLDTNICIYIMNQRPAEVIRRFKQTEPGRIGISSVTVSELEYGACKSNRPKRNQQRLEAFLIPFEILPYDRAASRIYGKIRARLERRGIVIGPLDLLIAAHALSQGRILISNNEKEFCRIRSLQVENWVR